MNDGQKPALQWIVAGLTLALVYVCWPLWPSLVLAAWTAALARPLFVRLERGLRGRRRAATALSLLLLLVLALPLALLVVGVIFGVQEIARTVAETSSATNALETIASGPERPQLPRLPTDLPSAIDLVQRYGAQGMNVLSTVAGAAATGLMALFVYFGGSFVFLHEGAATWRWCERHSPLPREHLERFGAAFHETGRGLLVGVGLTSATQGLVATIGYASLGIPRWWVLGPITGLASMLPLLGSALVWAPLMLGLFLTGHPIRASILAFLGIAVIGTVDNVLRPVFARVGALQIPSFLLFVSVFGGIATLGAWGAILGPLVVRLWMEALTLRREQA